MRHRVDIAGFCASDSEGRETWQHGRAQSIVLTSNQMSNKKNLHPNTSTYTHRNRQVHIPDGYLAVGLIVGVHGLRGEVKIELYTDFPERFQPDVQLLMGEELEPMNIARARPHKGHMLVQFAEVRNRSQAEELRNRWLFVPEEQAVELDEGTFWVHDIIGLQVHTEAGELLGTVSDVIFTGANEVYVVQPHGSLNRGREILLPAIADVVQAVNLETETMVVQLPPGLIDD